MSEIQRWRSDREGEMYEIPQDVCLYDNYVKTADHLADRAKFVRLLRAYRATDEKISGCCISDGMDLRCETCKEWDALEGMK